MKSKPFLIAVAAFALSASGVQAFGNSHMLERAGLSQAQISAFEIAREKRESGDLRGARDVLLEAGVDETVLRSVHSIAHQNQVARTHSRGDRHMMGMKATHRFHELTDDQREAIKVAYQANDKETVQAILSEAGLARSGRMHR
jgi:predicted DNA binding protein